MFMLSLDIQDGHLFGYQLGEQIVEGGSMRKNKVKFLSSPYGCWIRALCGCRACWWYTHLIHAGSYQAYNSWCSPEKSPGQKAAAKAVKSGDTLGNPKGGILFPYRMEVTATYATKTVFCVGVWLPNDAWKKQKVRAVELSQKSSACSFEHEAMVVVDTLLAAKA